MTVLIDQIFFDLYVGDQPELPRGYLFVCPTESFRAGPSSFRAPDCAAFWSLDPSGMSPLTSAEAARLGFPSIYLTTNITGRVWDGSVYAGLRRLHEAKGFNPDSRDIGNHLGHPLYFLEQNTHIPAPGEATTIFSY